LGWSYPWGYPWGGYPWGGYPWGYPYGYSSVVVSTPPVYVERPAEVGAPAPGYWYWCTVPGAWYPDVADCPTGWVPVPPRSEP
jgi:hypothetical protein